MTGSGKALDTADGSLAKGAQLVQATPSAATTTQQWTLVGAQLP